MASVTMARMFSETLPFALSHSICSGISQTLMRSVFLPPSEGSFFFVATSHSAR